MHLGSLESTQDARIALGCTSSNSYASFVLSKRPACVLDIRTLSMNKFLNHMLQEKIKGMVTAPGRNHCYSACVNRNGPGNEKF